MQCECLLILFWGGLMLQVMLRQEIMMTMGAVSPEAIHEIVDEIWLPLLHRG